MPRKQAEVCRGIHLHKGDDFEWTNHGEADCTISQCDPPLEQSSYLVPAGRTTAAKVRPGALSAEYPYKCSCNDLRTDPKIIIS
jgi:hypothetical protein